MALLTPLPKFQAFDSNGNPLSGGKLYTYIAGTTTPLATYTDQGGGTPNANPVILDSRGEANVWLGTTNSYKFVLKTSADVTIWTVDSISATGLATDVQNSAYTFIASVAGTNTITGTVSPTPTAYASGQLFLLVPANTNTGATTINLNSLGAKAIFAANAACTGGELVANVPCLIEYDGTQFQLVATGVVVTRTTIQTLTNKTLTSPAINTPTITGAVTGSTVAIGTGAGTATHVGVAHVNTTAVGNVGAGTDDLMSYTLPANSLSSGSKGIRVTAWGSTINNANAKALEFVFGGVVTTVTLTVSAAKLWFVEAIILRTGANAQDIAFRATEVAAAAALAAPLVQMVLGNTGQTDTAAITVKFTGAATGNNDIVQEGMLVEFLN